MGAYIAGCCCRYTTVWLAAALGSRTLHTISVSHSFFSKMLPQVPSKQALDAALRCLNMAAAFDTSVCTWLAGRADLPHQQHNYRLMAPLVLLLQHHHSVRVQMRAVGLLRTLLQHTQLLRSALLSGACTALLETLKSSPSGAIKLEVLTVSAPAASYTSIAALLLLVLVFTGNHPVINTP
jgi:hypothetical protein